MAEMEKTEFKFPHEKESAEEEQIEIEIEGEEVKIEVVDDTPEKDRNRPKMTEPPEAVTEEELSRYKDTRLKDRLSHLNKGYHEERRNKEAALRERDEAIFIAQKIIAENEKLKGSAHTNQKVLIEQAKKVVDGEVATAEREYKAAYEAGDSEALLAAQKKLTAATIRADKVANYRPQPLQTQENNVKPAPTPPPPAREVPVDDKAVSWKRNNDWFNRDREMTGFALAVHERLVDEEGIDPRSDAYYARIDSRMREKFPEKFSNSNGDKPRKSNVVAPATRSTAPKKIVLTPSAVSIAKRLGIPLELYARKVAEEMRNANG
tara:strand:- start:1538 stop:2500 length:963 start_codon:yes stop_codon:yes gene_type:complete